MGEEQSKELTPLLQYRYKHIKKNNEEIIWFSDVIKTNKYGMEQTRNLMISDKQLYSWDGYKVKR